MTIYPGERYDLLIKMTDEPGRKVYRMVVRTEERFFIRSLNQSVTYLPIYGLANLEFEDVEGMEEVDDGMGLISYN